VEQKILVIRYTASAGNCGSLSFPLKTPVLVRTDDHGWPAWKVQIMQVKYLLIGSNGLLAHNCFQFNVIEEQHRKKRKNVESG